MTSTYTSTMFKFYRNIFHTFYASNMNDGLVLQMWWKITQCTHLVFEWSSFAKYFAQHSVFYKILINVNIFQNACHVYSVESVSVIKFNLWVIFHVISGAMCFQLNHFLINIHTWSYYPPLSIILAQLLLTIVGTRNHRTNEASTWFLFPGCFFVICILCGGRA